MAMLRVRVKDLQPGDKVRGKAIQSVMYTAPQFPKEGPRYWVLFKSGRVARWNPSTEMTIERETCESV